MSSRTNWDAIIVGAGPAGSTTAALLAQRGHKVLLIDRCAFPRKKACGESVNPGAVVELRVLGLIDDVLSLPHGRIERWRIHPGRGKSFVGRLPDNRSGIAVDREHFDDLLLQFALDQGVSCLQGSQVVGLVREEARIGGVVMRDGTAHRARIVIGADGLRSVVARRAGLLARTPRLRKVGLTAHVTGATLAEGEGELYLRSWGCVGVVSLGASTANVVIVVNGSRRRSGDAGAWFDALSREVPALHASCRVGGVQATGPFDYPMKEVFGEGVLLVGDAAGYFDPFTGQGIYRALKGARLASEAASGHLASNTPDALTRYSTEHRAAFDPGVRLQKIVEATTSRPVLFGVIAAGLRSLPALADLVVGLTGDVPPARPEGISS